jgi:DNA-binding CsgD family transcriptional regulator/tetratricopeptide (TPR) repeat protein
VIGELAVAESLYQRSLDAANALGDRRGSALALCELCQHAASRGDYVAARRLGDESLAIYQALDDQTGQATALRNLGMVNYFEGDNDQARSQLERAWVLGNELHDQRLMAEIAFSLGMTYHVAGVLEAARLLYQQAHELDLLLGFRAGIGSVLNQLGSVATLQGDYGAARAYLHQSIAASREAGDRRRQAFTLSAVAGLAAALGAPERALTLDAAGIATLDVLGARLAPRMRAVYDGALRAAWDALGQCQAAGAWAAGRALTLERAVDEALDWLAAEDSEVPPSPDLLHERSEAPPEATSPQARPSAATAALTRRERMVVALLGSGHTTSRELAAVLGVSEGTAASYVQRVMSRLELRTRAQVAAWAVEHRLEVASAEA